jgi:hypothetical protein
VPEEDLFTAPAGWYPDPLGLPQLRWWNSHAWTEQTAAAHQPVVMQDTKFAWAEEDRPSRREERERERREESGAREPIDTALPTSDGLGELDPPAHAEPADPAAAAASSFDALFGPDAMKRPAGVPPAGESREVRDTHPPGPATSAVPIVTPLTTTPVSTVAPHIVSNTGAGWVIALIPLFQLVIAMLAVTTLGQNGNPAIILGVLVVPYFLVIPLAILDRRSLAAGGNVRPAHWAWSFLTAPVYLVMRARATVRESGQGIGPVLVWFALGVLQVVSVVALPGLLISAMPAVFADQVASSIESQAVSIAGTAISVSCDGHPPVLLGQTLTCEAVTSDGSRSDVTVELARANGWISWPVVDWGTITGG